MHSTSSTASAVIRRCLQAREIAQEFCTTSVAAPKIKRPRASPIKKSASPGLSPAKSNQTQHSFCATCARGWLLGQTMTQAEHLGEDLGEVRALKIRHGVDPKT